MIMKIIPKNGKYYYGSRRITDRINIVRV